MSSGINKAWLGLGGNIGNTTQYMASALQMLDEHQAINISKSSCVYKTPPWGLINQPWFFNCCVEIQTSLSPYKLLDFCQAVEKQGNRERKVRWGPRTIDVDILVFDGVEMDEERLTIPHPRMLERAFVLIPLAEIAPELIVGGRECLDYKDDFSDEKIEKLECQANWWQSRQTE